VGDAIGSQSMVVDLTGATAGNISMENSTGVVVIGALEGGANTSVNGSGHSGTNTNNYGDFVIGGAGLNATFAGTITGGTEGRTLIEVSGGGSLTLSNGGNTYATKTGTAPGYQGAGTTIMGNGQEPFNGSITAFLSGFASTGGGQLYVTNTTGSATGTTPVYVQGASSGGGSGGLLGGTGIIQSEVSTVINTVNGATNSAATLASYAAGGIIAPGALAGNSTNLGTLTISGGLQLGDDANLDYSLNTSPSATNDLLAVSNTTSGNGQVANSLVLPGVADSNGNWIEVNFSFPDGDPAIGTPYTLITYTGSDAYTSSGSSASLGDWAATGTVLGESAVFNDTGSSITVTFVPDAPPSSAGVIQKRPVFIRSECLPGFHWEAGQL
jgi:hypothetical protein